MTITERNRALKATIAKAFPGHKVSVRGSRGTAYGWVRVSIGYAPRNQRETRELTALVYQLIAAAKIEIGTYGYDDPGSDYGHGKTINIDFERAREASDYWGWRQELSGPEWDRLNAQQVAA